MGIGADISYNHYLNELVDIGIEGGWHYLPYETVGLTNNYLNIMSLLPSLGIHRPLGLLASLYVEGAGGVFLQTSSIDGTDSEFYWGLSPRLGFLIEMSPSLYLDTSFDYTHIFAGDSREDHLQWIGINVGLQFSFL